MESGDPAIDKPLEKEERDQRPETLSQRRNKPLPKRVDAFPELKDFYNDFDELDVTRQDQETYEEFLEGLEDPEKEVLKTHMNFYALQLENVGGLVMPAILAIVYADGSTEEMRIPAEVWRRNNVQAVKLLLTSQEIRSIELDPRQETADADLENNHWPRKPVKSRFKLFKEEEKNNPMQDAEEADEAVSAKKGVASGEPAKAEPARAKKPDKAVKEKF